MRRAQRDRACCGVHASLHERLLLQSFRASRAVSPMVRETHRTHRDSTCKFTITRPHKASDAEPESRLRAFPIEKRDASGYRRKRVDGDDIAVAPSCHPTSRGEQHGCEEEGEEEDEEKGEEEGKAEVAFPFRPSWSRSAGSRASSSSRATIGRPSPDPHKSAAPVPLSATRCAGLSGAQAFSGQRRSLFQLVPRPWASAARPGAGLRAASVSAKHCRP